MSGHEDESLVSVDELVAVLREHEGPPHPIANESGAGRSGAYAGRSQRRIAFLAAGVAAALLLGSGLGFGLGSAVTPSSSARDNFVGFGFLPARNWNVVQSGGVGAGTKGHAVAANVPLRDTGANHSVPYATLESLPRRGIVIAATFGLRGDPAQDVEFTVGALPLRIADARVVPPASAGPLPASVTQLRLRMGIGGSNVDARIYFGSAPTQTLLALAQRQLDRLVVASDDVTIAARPQIVPSDKPVTLFGAVANGEADEEVEIQARDCGQSFFRVVAGTTTHEGGGWSMEFMPGITTTVRAVWKGHASSQVTLRQRAILRFAPKASDRTRFVVSVVARAQFWHRKVQIQRFDRRLGTWKLFRSVLLTEQNAPGAWTWTSGEFTARLPKGTMLRAVLPAPQARPCYLSGTSYPVRT
jgi:hypothetical protein